MSRRRVARNVLGELSDVSEPPNDHPHDDDGAPSAPLRSPVLRQYRVRVKIVDVRPAPRHSTHDARGVRIGCHALVGPRRASRPHPEMSRPASPAGRPRAFGSTLPSSRPFTVVVFAAVVASLEGRAQAGPAGHCRPLASRGVPSMLAPPRAAAAGKATHRF